MLGRENESTANKKHWERGGRKECGAWAAKSRDYCKMESWFLSQVLIIKLKNEARILSFGFLYHKCVQCPWQEQFSGVVGGCPHWSELKHGIVGERIEAVSISSNFSEFWNKEKPVRDIWKVMRGNGRCICIHERERETRRVDHHWSKRTPKNLLDQGKLSLLD